MYKTSKDYDRLWELLNQKAEIACWIKGKTKDKLLTLAAHDNEHPVLITANPDPIVFMDYCVFESKCIELNLVFLDPEPPTCETCKWWNGDKCNSEEANDAVLTHNGNLLCTCSFFGCIFYEPKESEE